jgi:hypothetical protein
MPNARSAPKRNYTAPIGLALVVLLFGGLWYAAGMPGIGAKTTPPVTQTTK